MQTYLDENKLGCVLLFLMGRRIWRILFSVLVWGYWTRRGLHGGFHLLFCIGRIEQGVICWSCVGLSIWFGPFLGILLGLGWRVG